MRADAGPDCCCLNGNCGSEGIVALTPRAPGEPAPWGPALASTGAGTSVPTLAAGIGASLLGALLLLAARRRRANGDQAPH